MKKILAIDRDEVTTEHIRQLLASKDRQIFIAATGKETLTLLNSKVFDMVIVNPLTMPEFDVLEWLEQYSALTKVIVISPTGTFPLPKAGGGNVIATLPTPVELSALEDIVNNNLMDNGFFGVLNDVSLADYIQLICMKSATKAIRVSQQNDKGLILIRDGQVIYAAQDNLLGMEAFFRILSWKKGSFRDVKIKIFPTPNIDRDYRSLLVKATALKEISQDASAIQEARPVKADDKPVIDRPALKQGRSMATEAMAHPVPAATNSRQSRIPPPPAKRTLSRRAVFALAAILPALILAFLIQFFGPTSKLSLPDFAASGPSPALASPEKSPPAASSSTIAIGSLREPDTPPLREETVLRLHGSNTIGAKLAPALVAEYLTMLPGAEKVEQLPGNKENETRVKARARDRVLVVDIQAHGSSTGFKDMEAGACDIAMASRKIQDREVAALEVLGLGEMTASASEHVIALDGIAIIVNMSNPIEQISMQQLAAIYSGQVTDWSAVGGTPGPINVYARDDNSGTYDTFKSIVLDKLKLKEGSRRFESNPELSEQVSRDPQGIGFTSLPNINKTKALAVADTGAKPIYPSFFTVSTEDYPIARRLYLYTAANPANHHVRDFVEFVHSRRGQEIVNKADMVDMNIKPFFAEKIDPAKIARPATIQEYLQGIENAQRLSLNFRFTTGAAKLDNRSERDLNRMVDFLKNKLDRQIILAGFADNSGDYVVNRQLAQTRAETVAKEMQARGIAVQGVYSGGQELPVASNLSAAGQNKNRRVEVWLR